MPQIRYVLFDFFNTLVDYKADAGTLHEMFAPLTGLLSEDDLVRFGWAWQMAVDELLANAKRTHDEFSMHDWARKAGVLFGGPNLSEEMLDKVVEAYMAWWHSHVQVYEDTLAVLPLLREKYTLGIISNTFHKPTVPSLLAQFGLTNHFACVVTSVNVGRRKPSPDIFQAALAQLNAQPEECCFIGDNFEEDVLGARRAGLRAIQICRKEQQAGTLASLDQLPGMLAELYSLG